MFSDFVFRFIAEREARLMIVQCGVEIWANICMYVCMYVCKMSCYWAPHVNYAYEPPRQCATRVLKSTSHVLSRYDMERHRRNATEELRDSRQLGDRERRMVAR